LNNEETKQQSFILEILNHTVIFTVK